MSIKHVAYCTDFSENADYAFLTAMDMAAKYRAKLTILHVIPPEINPLIPKTKPAVEEDSTLVFKIQELFEERYKKRIHVDIEYEFEILDGHPSTEIIRYLESHPIDAVILGSYGLTGMGLVLFGSVAQRVAHEAPCSVMIVRKKEG